MSIAVHVSVGSQPLCRPSWELAKVASMKPPPSGTPSLSSGGLHSLAAGSYASRADAARLTPAGTDTGAGPPASNRPEPFTSLPQGQCSKSAWGRDSRDAVFPTPRPGSAATPEPSTAVRFVYPGRPGRPHPRRCLAATGRCMVGEALSCSPSSGNLRGILQHPETVSLQSLGVGHGLGILGFRGPTFHRNGRRRLSAKRGRLRIRLNEVGKIRVPPARGAPRRTAHPSGDIL